MPLQRLHHGSNTQGDTMKTITCAIQKGGQGKSMLCTHIAFLAAEMGKRVLVVDLDSQGTLSRNLAVEFDRAAAPAFGLFKGAMRPALPLSLAIKTKGTIAAYTGDRALVAVDETPSLQAQALRKSLATLVGSFDLCVIDPPPTLGKRLSAALIASDFVVMPFVPARESVDGLGDLMETIEQHKQEHNPDLHVLGLLPNKVNSRSASERRIIADIADAAPGMLLPMRLHERTSVSGAMAESRPVWARQGGASQRLAAEETRSACAHILKTVFKK
jgi:chromosome partitioning protein